MSNPGYPQMNADERRFGKDPVLCCPTCDKPLPIALKGGEQHVCHGHVWMSTNWIGAVPKSPEWVYFGEESELAA